MTIQSRKLLLTTAITLALGIGTATAIAQNSASDAARMESRIVTTYDLSRYLHADNLSVSVDQEGEAILAGFVEDDVSRDLAEQIAMGVDGIKSVDNRIEIRTNSVPIAPNSERSYGDKIDDFSTATAVKSKLLWSKHTDGIATKVDSIDGKVTLHGNATSDISKELAGRIALNTDGVREVDNQLRVVAGGDSAESSTLTNAGEEISDTWITTKVLSTYLYSSNLNASDIDVSTDKGVVSLSGDVDSAAEHELAVELASNIKGVHSVKHNMLSHATQ
jgi:osmotically-inducible protein OsmY